MKTTKKLIGLMAAFRCALACQRHLEFAGRDPSSSISWAAIDEALKINERQRDDLLKAKAYLNLQRQRLAEYGVDAPDGLGLHEIAKVLTAAKARHPKEWEELDMDERKRQQIRWNLDAITERG